MDNWHSGLALTYLEETKHSYQSLLDDRHFLDWGNQPQPLKSYRGLEAIPYCLLHAVEGVTSGAYVWHPPSRSLELLAASASRQEAGTLALGQDPAEEASVLVFALCDLLPIVERLGNRGYRAAQLEAGLMGGRMYLAAYAQGLGATGLTFLDDDVTAYFAPHAAAKSVMFLLAMGYTAHR